MKSDSVSRRFCLLLVTVILSASLLTGCQKSFSPPSTVTGKVTLDGKPLAAGSIEFMATGADASQMSSISAKITNGEYTASVIPGNYQVQIKSPKSLGVMPGAAMPSNMMSEQTVETLPAIYNLRSQLTCNVEPKETVANFELKSK